MLTDELQNEIIVKTSKGDFKLLKNGKLEDLPGDELMTVEDDIISKKKEDARIKKATANFYFDVDDEQEARELADEDMADKNRRIKEFIDQTVEEIMGQFNLSKENLQQRNIILSRLRGVRSLAQARESLLQLPVAQRGALTKDKIGELLSLVEEKRLLVEEAIRTGRVNRPLNQETTKSLKQGIIKDVPIQDKTVAQGNADLRGVEYNKKEMGRVESFQHETIGPVEEIRQINLKEFRRLGADPKESAARVEEKINLLEDVSLIKKAEGIRAWKESEVNKLYLAIGAKSMGEKKPIDQVIRELKQQNKPFLAPEEFNAVADLNRRLSY